MSHVRIDPEGGLHGARVHQTIERDLELPVHGDLAGTVGRVGGHDRRRANRVKDEGVGRRRSRVPGEILEASVQPHGEMCTGGEAGRRREDRGGPVAVPREGARDIRIEAEPALDRRRLDGLAELDVDRRQRLAAMCVPGRQAQGDPVDVGRAAVDQGGVVEHQAERDHGDERTADLDRAAHVRTPGAQPGFERASCRRRAALRPACISPGHPRRQRQPRLRPVEGGHGAAR